MPSPQTPQSRATFLFSLLSVLAETAVFLQLGLSVFSTRVKHIQPLLIFWTFVLVFAGRALNVYPLSWVVNRCVQRVDLCVFWA